MPGKHIAAARARAAARPRLARPSCAAPAPGLGFTLVEVLVALVVMALMALMSWRGVDAMLRAQSALQQRADSVRTLQSGLAQWHTDLNRLVGSTRPGLPAWDWDGKVLRLTREAVPAEDGLQVVAWSWREDAAGAPWLRWQSPPLRTHSEWQAAWQNARVWSQTPTAELRAFEVPIQTLSGWQLFVHLGGSWTHPLSNASTATNNSNPSALPNSAVTGSGAVPDGVRLQLDLPPTEPLTGRLTLDWVRPSFTGTAP